MNKKIISRIILSSSFTLSLSTVAVSCLGGTVVTTSNVPTPKLSVKTELNPLANKITLDYPDKENIFAAKSLLKNVVSSNFDKDKYEVTLIQIDYVPVEESVDVRFLLKEKQTGSISNEVKKRINGFRKDLNVRELNDVAKKVVFNYPNLQRVFVGDAVQNSLTPSGFDNKRFIISIISFRPTTSNSLQIQFTLKNSHNNISSDVATFLLSGFKAVRISKPDLDAEVNKVVIDFPNKEETLLTNINVSGFVAKGYDTSKYDISFLTNIHDQNSESSTVSFRLVDKNHKDNFSKSRFVTISGFKVFVPSPESLDEEAAKVKITINNMGSLLPQNVSNSDIIFSNLDTTKFEIVETVKTPLNDNTALMLSFKIKDIKSGVTSDVTSAMFKNFLLTPEAFAKELTSATLDFKEKITLEAGNAIGKTDDFVFGGIDTKRVKPVIEKTSLTSDSQGIDVVFKLIQVNNVKNTSETKTVTITGFKPTPQTKIELNKNADMVRADVDNKSTIFITSLTEAQISFSGIDTTKFEIIDKRISLNSDETSVSIEFKVKDVNSENVSDKKTIVISGFKFPRRTTAELAAELAKVQAEYPNKSTVLASETVRDNFVFSGFDVTKFNISLTEVKTNNEARSATLVIKVEDKNYADNLSEVKEIVVNDFKRVPFTVEQLNKLAENIRIDYQDKAVVYPWDVNPQNFSPANVAANTTISDIKLTGLKSENLNAIVSFNLSDSETSTVKTNHSVEISGFKTLQKNHSNLSTTLLNDEKGFINLDTSPSTTLSLYSELAKPDAEIELNFTTNKILIPASGKQINLTKPDTYIEVGSLSESYQTVHKRLISEITKFLSGKLSVNFIGNKIDAYGSTSNFFTSPKEKAISQFKGIKTKLGFAEHIPNLKKEINFIKDYVKNIETLINKDNFSVIYNHKTGLFAMQTGDNEIDLSKPETFINFIGFKPKLKDELTAKIKEVLTAEGINVEKFNLFLNDTSSNSGYVFQKNGADLITGIIVQQIPKTT